VAVAVTPTTLGSTPFVADYALESGLIVRARCIEEITQVIHGDVGQALINTSFAERQNLTLRKSMKAVYATDEHLQQGV
jgi:hypothetical protein